MAYNMTVSNALLCTNLTSVVLQPAMAASHVTAHTRIRSHGLAAGPRPTAYEAVHAGLSVTFICDSVAAALMAEGKVDAVVVGADRVAANGDTANKIGTYTLAVLANHHK